MYGRHPAYAGRRAIDRFLAAHVREVRVFEALDIRTGRIDDPGRYVIEYASHIAGLRAGDQSGVDTGTNTAIWRRERGGAPKVFRGMAMYDRALDASRPPPLPPAGRRRLHDARPALPRLPPRTHGGGALMGRAGVAE